MASVARSPRCIVLGLLVLAGQQASCAALQPRPIHAHERAAKLSFSGTGSVSPSGEFTFTVADNPSCEKEIVELWCKETREGVCGDTIRKARRVQDDSCDTDISTLTVQPPWGPSQTVELDDERSVTVSIDWEATQIDPLAANAREVLKSTWLLSINEGEAQTKWVPKVGDIESMLVAIGNATKTEVIVKPVANKESAKLVVKSLAAERDKLVSGQDNQLRLTLRNEGRGPAYQVIAQTRSSNPELHNLQFSFGRIDPAAVKTKTLDVALTPAPKDSSAMVVIIVSSYRDKVAAEHRKRFAISRTPPKPKLPKLSLSCKLEGQAAGAAVAYPGKETSIWCTVRNDGQASARNVNLAVKVGREVSKKRLRRRIARRRSSGGRVVFRIPASAQIGTEFPVVASVTSSKLPQPVTQTLTIKIVKASLCPAGLIKRDAYKKQRGKLEQLLKEGSLTQAEFDEYDADLVRCLE